ncbi:MAG: hypothetical protein H0X24_13415, partial [Ktedonobacterales bacterium]|nr:hypothetical protein [Ktedonobacterales bacterium]
MISASPAPPSAPPLLLPRATPLAAWLWVHRFLLAGGAIILVAVGVRLALVAAGWPGSDSDDATMGLMARHILLRGEHPIFFYGQAYMGTIEAYLGALFYAVMGVSAFALKCGLIVLYGLFMGVMYALLAWAFQPRVALVGLVLLAVGADEQLKLQLEAYGGYLETLLFGALLIVITMWLIRRAGGVPHTWQGWGGFALWGLIAGVAIWSDPLVAPFVALAFVPLVLLQRRQVRRWVVGLAVLGFVVGVAPWLVYIGTSPSFSAAKSFLKDAPTHHVGTLVQPSTGQPLIDHLLGVVVISVPNRTGVTAICHDTAAALWPPAQWGASGMWGCLG